VALGRLATFMKSLGVRVIPMLSMRAAKAAVKYSVVNHAKLWGDLRAIPVKRTVHTGNKVVATLAVFSYASKILVPKLFSSSVS
jgi:hypothetical protein